MHIKPLPKFLLLAAVVGGVLFGYRHLVTTGTIRRPSILKTVIPLKADELSASVLTAGSVAAKPLPSSSPLQPCADGNTSNCLQGSVQEVETWAWNANMALHYSVGGTQTTKGSLAAAHGAAVTIRRQDDTGQMQSDLLDCAQRLLSDPNASCTKFVTIMGDGGAQFFRAINPKLAKVCPDCIVKTIAVLGYSRGEDGFWGPAAWKANPEKAKGGVVVGVLRDGDWNIAEKWAGQNAIPNNPDDTVYDPNALNWINADDYVKAANAFASGTACMDVPIKGKLTGGKGHYCADAVVTWTPGDVTVAKKCQGGAKCEGAVPIMTTAQSVFQMPCILVGIDRWMKSHRTDVQNMIAASFEAADQVRSNPAALQKAAEISAKIYKEESPEYWLKYYRGVTESDTAGVQVHLGGSSVANLADNLQAFGLSGGPSLFAATYTTFGKIVVQQYPRLVPDFPPVSEILDTSYVAALRGSLPENNGEQIIKADASVGIRTVEGKKNYSIQFASGRSDILPQSYADLDQLASDISLTNYKVALNGYTDNARWQGINEQSADRNQQLSEARANSVKDYLVNKGIRNAIRVHGYGEDNPVADNDTPAGRALNRRVQVVVGE